MTARELNEFREALPNAVHLAGYGNTLFGVLMEVADGPRRALDYFPPADRVRFQVVAPAEGEGRPTEAERGGTGRVLFHRLDESCLLVGVVERDEAECIPPSPEALALGFAADGLRDPRPAAALNGRLQLGLY